MSADYSQFLAAALLTEDRVISYRLLSRELKCHVNTAKRMLYEFHHLQNGKKPGTIHATYLIGGVKRVQQAPVTNGHQLKNNNDDTYMQSSPFASSMPQVEDDSDEEPVFSVTLVREEDLEEARTRYEKISSIHIYSLEPHSLKDFQVLSDATREVFDRQAAEDPCETVHTYGTITNKNVRRRAARRPQPTVPKAAVAVAARPMATIKSTPKPIDPGEKEEKTSTTQPSAAKDFFGRRMGSSSASPKPTASTSKPSPKESAGIFKAFAKAKQSSTLSEESRPSTPKPETPKVKEDEEMKDADDSEDDYVPPVQAPKTNVDADRKARLEREAKLKAMMEDDSEEENPADKPAETNDSQPQVESQEASQPDSDAAATQESTGPRRRRGRRRVMKKTTVQDEDGFLVTKDEPVWESFSEDEPVVPKSKPTSTSGSFGGATKQKKAPAKPAQGRDIMSFFGKK